MTLTKAGIAAVVVAGLLLPAQPGGAAAATQPVGWGPLRSKKAAKLIKRSGYEPRPANKGPNNRVPKRSSLEAWRTRSEMPYAKFVNGRFRGTTDEIIEWAARKWGLDADVLRAVAVIESWWRMSAVGDAGDSFGLYQVRRPYHCWEECWIARRFTAFNADYYGGIIRAYFDGKMGWLNTVERGRDYAAGDLWGSVGAWFSGRWYTQASLDYIARVQERLAERTWRLGYFVQGLTRAMPVDAVVFDLDGVLIDSEQVWDEVRREYVPEHGGRWRDEATRAMMGMSSVEWSRYLVEQLGVDKAPERVSEEVAARVAALYRERLPLLPGAREAVERIAVHWPLALATSSNRAVIDLVLDVGGLGPFFEVTVSSEEVGRGKPAPDVYIEAARRLSVAPERCAAIEDSHNGILSAVAAGMRVIAIPNREFPPGDEALSAAAVVLPSIERLTVDAIDSTSGR